MKKIITTVFTVLLLTVCSSLVTSQNTYAKLYTLTTITSTSPSRTSYEFTKYDITGDGKKDRIACYYSNYDRSYSAYMQMSIWINDKNALTINSEYGVYGFGMQLCKLDGRKPYLFIRTIGEDEYADVCAFFLYKKGKLKTAYNCKKMVKPKKITSFGRKVKSPQGLIGEVLTMSGSEIYYIGQAQFPATGPIRAYFRLKPKKNGNLKLVSYKGRIPGGKGPGSPTISKDKYYKLLKTTKAYSSAKSGIIHRKYKKGTKLKITNMYFGNKKVRIKVKDKSGRAGWIDIFQQRKEKWTGMYGSGYTYKTLFEGLGYAG